MVRGPNGAGGKRQDKAAPRRRLGAALVIEDDPIIAMVVADILRDGGADPVETCATTEEGRAALERLQPAIVVLDVHLADRDDGWAFAELLPLMGPPSPQVIFATGSPRDIPPAIAALGTVLAKPFTPADLLRIAGHPHAEGLLGRLRGAFTH